MKTCAKCGKEYPATTEYFHKNTQLKDELHKICKKCKSEYDREIYKKKKKSKEKKPTKTQIEKNKKAEEGYRKILNKPRDYGIGDKLNTLKLENGKNYKIEHIYDQTNNIKVQFIGKLVGQTDILIILKHNTGYKECYRKFDILSGYYKIKEAQN